jgi:hypothetical protein
MKTMFIAFYLTIIPALLFAEMTVTVLDIAGNVQVRYGIEERWHSVTPGLLLRDIDTIMTGEEAEVILELSDGRQFVLSSNSILDIADLRTILQKELFMYLTTQKIKRIELPEEKRQLRMGDVSVVHGSKKDADSTDNDSTSAKIWNPEFNGALALHLQKFFPNAIVKLHKILEKYGMVKGSQKIYFYIAKSLEALNLNGQAIDAYQFVIDHAEQSDSSDEEARERAAEARKAIKRLRAKG